MSVSVAVTGLGEKLLQKVRENDKEAKEKVLKQIVKDTDEYVPYKTGKLSSNVEVKPISSEIVYKEEYASFAFEPVSRSGKPKKYSVERHSNAQGYPLQAAEKENSDKWAELYAKELLNGVE